MSKNIRKRDFIKQEKIVRICMVMVFILVLALAHVLAFNVIAGKPFTFASASEVVKFSQKIRPINPIKETKPIKKENMPAVDLHSSNFRIISPLPAIKLSQENQTEIKKIKTGPIVTFSGTSTYPNAIVFLEIHSKPFFSSTLSDDQGRWTWTNYGQPLEEGDHLIESYSMAPMELAGKRDVLAQKYSFTVANEPGVFNNISLGSSEYEKKDGTDSLGSRIKNNDLSTSYVFQTTFPNRKEYSSGDNMDLQLLFLPLGNYTKNEALIDYAIYAVDENDNVDMEEAAQFSDVAQLEDGGYFLKSITLKDALMPGNYLMKVSAKIGEDVYVQSLKFSISAKALMSIGSNVVTVEKFGKVMVYNVIIIITVLIGLIFLIIVEFRRFLVYRPIGEDVFKNKGYFTK